MRAWRSAILGLVVCPGVLHIYSLYLLARVAMSGEELPPHLNWRFYFALAIDLLFPFLILVSFQMMYYSSYSFLGI
jgi:hypothetical protein